MTETITSPDSLKLRSKVDVGPRLGKRAAIILGVVIAIMIFVVIYNTESRRHQMEEKPKAAARDATKSLMPASQTADAFNAKITDEVKIAMPPPPAPVAIAPPSVPPLATPPLVLQGQTQVPEIAKDDAARALIQSRENDLKAAREAPSKAASWQAEPASASAAAPASLGALSPTDAKAQLQAAMDQARQAASAATGGAGGADQDANGQAKKLAFLQGNQQLDTPVLAATRQPQHTPYELKTGTVIPGVLLQGINSDLPGEMVALVTQTVYDTATGTQVLIPQGSKLFGRYDSSVSYGQSGALVAWQRLIYPDGSTLELGGMQGDSPNGYSGFRDKVNNHYGRLVGFAVLTSLFSAGYQLSQPQTSSANGQLTNQQVIGGAVGQEVTQLGMEVTRKNLSIQPTIEVRPGYRFVVMVNRDIVFAKPYVP